MVSDPDSDDNDCGTALHHLVHVRKIPVERQGRLVQKRSKAGALAVLPAGWIESVAYSDSPRSFLYVYVDSSSVLCGRPVRAAIHLLVSKLNKKSTSLARLERPPMTTDYLR